MRKVNGITAYWFLLILIISSYSFAASENDQPKTKVEFKRINTAYSKIQHFDSLEVKDSLDYYINAGYKLCEEIDFKSVKSTENQIVIAEIYRRYGLLNFFSNNVFESISGYEKAIDIFKKHDKKARLADCFTSLATNYSKVGREPMAMELMQKATSIFIDLDDTRGVMVGYRSIGLLYKRQRDNVRALEYLNKAIVASKDLNDADATIHLLVSLASLHKIIDELEKSLELYFEALKLLDKTDELMTKLTVYSNLGGFYKATGNLDSTKIYFDKANVLIDEMDSDYKRSFILFNYSDYYYLRKDYQQAILYGEKALLLSEKIKNKRAEFVTLNILIKIYEEIKDYDKLTIYQERVIAHLFEQKDELNEQINELETVRFKLDKQNMIAENEQIKKQLIVEQENQRREYIYILFSSLFVILLTFSLIVYFRLRNTREYNKKILKQSEERKLLLQEVHHRVKNNFQIVSSMLRLQSYGFESEVLRQNFEEAVNRINAMAIVHNVIYRQEKFKDIDVKNYLERLVENLHKSGDSRIVISIDSEEIPFKIETLINLGIALNELITNSFKHAFNAEIAQPKINISLRKIGEKTFELIYRDNGIGYNHEECKSSFGMELIETIISNFDGEVTFAPEENWNTVIKITFKED